MKWKHVKNLKRFGAAFMAAALTITALPDLDLTALAAGREIIKNGTFDSDLSGWESYSNGTITYCADKGNAKAGSMKISRSKNPKGDSASGTNIDITGKVEAGQTYEVKASFYYDDIDNAKSYDSTRFNLCIFFGASWTHAESIIQMLSGNIERGKWCTLEGEFKVPEDADVSKVRIFPETIGWKASYKEEDLITYYMDDVSFKKVGADADEPEDVIDPASQIKLEAGTTKTPGRNNPLIDYRFGADPYAMEYNGRVYVYMTNDSQQFDATEKDAKGYPVKENSYDKINTITVLSSSDMVNWTNHGNIPVAGANGAAKWAKNSWAPAVCHKQIDGKEQFFLYFADGGGGIGVLVADTPIGPFHEPSGKDSSRLIKWGTQASDGVVWLFDPAVLVDDDGTGYLYYGGGVPAGKENMPGTSRVVKLKDNMVELDGNAVAIEAPAVFEDSGIHKHNGTYYYTYCSNWNNTAGTGIANICVMTSDNPMGPFTYKGIAFENQNKFFGIGGNNHHCFFDFNGKHYFTYHAQTVTKALGIPSKVQVYRSTHIQEVEYDTDNKTIKPIIGTYEGVDQTQNLDPYTRVEAETIGWAKGITTADCEETGSMVDSINQKVTDITDGDYIAVSKAAFGDEGAKSFTLKAKALAGGCTVDVYLDAPDAGSGKKVGTINIPVNDASQKNLLEMDYWKFTKNGTDSSEETASVGDWQEYSCDVTGVTGTHDVYLVIAEGQAIKDQKAEAVDKLIEAIGTVSYTDACKAKIDAARTAYNELTLSEREAVTKYDVLTAAEAAYKEGYHRKKAEKVDALIDAIGVVEYTTASKELIDAARDAYDDLSEVQQKFVTKLAILEKAEADYQALKDQTAADQENLKAASAVKELIASIGTVTASSECKTKIDAARAAYDKLTDAQKLFVENAEILTKAEADYKKLTEKPSENTKKPSDNEQKPAGDVKNPVNNEQKPAEGNTTATVPVEGNTYSAGGFTYRIISTSDKTAAVVSANKKTKTIKIGSTVTIKNVSFKITAIEKNAFKGNKKVTTVKIGKNVQTIGANAFSGCTKLQKVTINSKNLSKMEAKAFYKCKKLKNIKISSLKLKTVGKNAFKGIAKKAKIDVPNKKVKEYKRLFKKGNLAKNSIVK